MRKAFAIVILLCIAYFIGGWIAVHFGLFDKNSYFSYAGVVGALASVVGLLSFTKPALTKSDLQEIELDSLKSIAQTTEQLKKLESERAKTKEELGNLELQKKKMELLVKKASLALFLKEQYAHHEKKIADEIENNQELTENLAELQEISRKLDALEEEIEADPNVLQLRQIMASASRRQHTLEEAIDDMPPIQKLLFIFVRDLSRAMSNLIGTIK